LQAPAGFAGGNELHNALIGFMPGDITIIVMANVKDIADEIGNRLRDVAAGKKPQPFEEPNSFRLYKIFESKGKEYVKSNLKDISIKMFDLPYDYRFLNYFGTQFINAGAIDLAIDAYTINAQLFPSVSNVWYNLGYAYFKKGDKANTEKYCVKALEVDPDNKHAKSMLDKLKTL
jgi:tetratricopeptide (TPR) repeat protein